jgi:hypothetical protein
MVNSAERIQNNSSTTTDNTLVDNSRIKLLSISPIIDGLSNHDAPILTIQNLYATITNSL